MLVALTGGTGGAKLVQGLCQEMAPNEVTVVCNTADDLVFHGLHISPDVDTIMYTLAGLSDENRGWGIRGDTFFCLEQFERYGCETWFRLGDKDLATHITRTQWLRDGMTLSCVTRQLSRALGVSTAILPMSDNRVETRVQTVEGELSFQEYFVKRRWQPEVRKVFYAGIENSRPAPEVLEGIGKASAIVICPSNPVTSIGPIVAVPGVRDALRQCGAPVLAVSPLIGRAAISGPAHKLMPSSGMEPSVSGVAKAYADFIDIMVVDASDHAELPRIAGLGMKGVATNIRMASISEKRRLAREVLALLGE